MVRRTVNMEKNNVWDRKYTEVNTYIGGRKCAEVWRFIKLVKTERQKTALLQVISPSQWVRLVIY